MSKTIAQRIAALPRPLGTAVEVAERLGVPVTSVRQVAHRHPEIRLAPSPRTGASRGGMPLRAAVAARQGVNIRLTEQERAQWQAAADAAGLTLSEWVRAAAGSAIGSE